MDTRGDEDGDGRGRPGRDRYYDRRPDGWSDVLSKWITIIIGIVILIGAAWGSIAVLNGGFELGSQVAVDNLTSKFDDLSNRIDKLTKKVEDIPRASDFSAADRHLSNLDSQISGIYDRFNKDEVRAQGTDTRVDSLQDQMDRMNGLPVRQPRRRDGN